MRGGTQSTTDRGSLPLEAAGMPQWDRLVESLGPASLLVLIESRMGPALRARVSPEDILQESLMHAWNDRAAHEWRGLRAYRNWLLSIIDHRIRDSADREGALKRGGGRSPTPLGTGTDGGPAVPVSTTASRIEWYREQAAATRAAIDALPEDVRAIVRLRLVEQRTVEEIATQLGLGVSAVRHRFRRGAELFRARMTAMLGASAVQKTRNPGANPTAPGAASSS